MNRYTKVRELVKDPLLTIKDIAQQTGYNKGHVSRLRKASQQFECPRCGPEYERGFVDGMRHQMQLSVKINKEPTKIFGPGLEELLNSAGFYRKREWVGLTPYEIQEIHSGNQHWGNFACAIEAKLKEKNHG